MKTGKSKKLSLWLLTSVAFAMAFTLFPRPAAAGAIELSVGFSFNKSNYSDNNISWNRRWGASVGYHLTELSEIEISFTDMVDRTRIKDYEDTTFHDQVYSANWVQSLAGKNSPIQPYVKAGIGQLNREATGTYWFGASPPAIVDSVTGVLGAGLRIYLTRAFAVRAEATSYLHGGRINTWKDNTAVTFGLSSFF